MKKYPEGFPLSPKDVKGNALKKGDIVKIIKIPDWVIGDLDDQARKAVENCKDQKMVINEIDDYGYMWFEKIIKNKPDEYISYKFCIDPSSLEKNE